MLTHAQGMTQRSNNSIIQLSPEVRVTIAADIYRVAKLRGIIVLVFARSVNSCGEFQF